MALPWIIWWAGAMRCDGAPGRSEYGMVGRGLAPAGAVGPMRASGPTGMRWTKAA